VGAGVGEGRRIPPASSPASGTGVTEVGSGGYVVVTLGEAVSDVLVGSAVPQETNISTIRIAAAQLINNLMSL